VPAKPAKKIPAKKPSKPAVPSSADQRVRIEYMALSTLRRAKRNPKKHAVEGIQKAFGGVGFVDPLVLDESTQTLAAGHGRLDALTISKDLGNPAPDRIEVRDGEWFVPVVRGVSFKNDEEAEGYLVGSNQLVIAGGWDDKVLVEILSSVRFGAPASVAAMGMTQAEIEKLIQKVGGKQETAEDEVPAAQKKAVSKLGTLWELGEHRILCGDCTDPVTVARLMEDRRAVLFNSDPPYGVNYGEISGSRATAKHKEPKYDDIENDDLDAEALQLFLEKSIRAAVPSLNDRPAFYLWHPMLTQGTFFAAAAAADILIHRQIIWVKPSLILGRGDYHWRHEIAFYGWIKGRRCPFYGPKNQTSIWEIGRENDLVHPRPRSHSSCLRSRCATTRSPGNGATSRSPDLARRSSQASSSSAA